MATRKPVTVAAKTASKTASKTAPKNRTAPVKAATAKKAAPTKKAVPAKKAAPAKAKAAKPGKPPKIHWGPQSFVASHLKDAAFKTGLRSYAAYRDLNIEKATGGAVQAHVIRLLGKCDPKVVSIPHYHGVQFQMLYMLKGWMIGEYEGAGRVKMTAGSCWIQPPGIRHQVIDYSDGCEMIEIILPAKFATVEL